MSAYRRSSWRARTCTPSPGVGRSVVKWAATSCGVDGLLLGVALGDGELVVLVDLPFGVMTLKVLECPAGTS
jgi:hypothetical protein